ncbi:exonuclease domain-containing protein [Lysinibacillus sp. LZ02]|uniref:exonuclease domain-containing protein n=1 Tax=Lysinibacillus sp. LZ02 TaxID=3420668 RepID=UPI003D35E548
MRKNTYICIDIEAALIRGRQYMIELGAVKWNPDGTMDTFTQLIQPYKFKKLNSHIQKLTGITTEQLLGAPSFKEAMYTFKRWCKGDCIFLTFGEFDRKVFEDELGRNYMKSDFIFPMIDFQQKYMIAHHIKEQPSLAGLMKQLGLEAEVQHRALADADSLRKIFEATNGEWLIEQQKTNHLRVILSSLKPMETHYDLVLCSIDLQVQRNGIVMEKVSTIYEQLEFSVHEEQRTNNEGETEMVQLTTIHPSEIAKNMLAQLVQTVDSKVILTRAGLRPLSKVFRLHSCSMPKTEMMTLQQILRDEEAIARFSMQDEPVHVFEAKICHLLKKYEHLLVEEFTKRDLFPKETIEL